MCMGNRLCAWATVFVRGRLLWCVATVFVRGGRFHAWAVGLVRGWLLGLVGSLLRVGLLSCGSAGTIVEGWVVLTMLKNNDERRMSIRRSSFSCHITDSDVALCSVCFVCFTCVLRLSWLCGARIGGHGVWRWMVKAGDGGRRVWMMVVTWKVVGLGFGQNSHSRNLPKSFLGKPSNCVSIA